MKKTLFVSSIIFIGCCLYLFSSCTSEDNTPLPTLGLTEIGIITEATANCASLITSDGGFNITARGVCWSTTPNPTIENDKTFDAYGTGEYTSTLTNLSPNTTYYVRAYATNKGGTAYGIQATFTTKTLDLSTIAATSITANSAISIGIVSSDGDSLTYTERGICWSTSINPTIDLETKTVDCSRTDTFACTMTNLLPNTIYHARIYATNSVGTTYGNEIDFTTRNGLVILTTNTAKYITANSASFGGTITDDGGATVTERGLCWSTSANPTVGLSTKTVNDQGVGSFSSNLTGLIANTTYYVRAYATNSVGTTYGDELSFTTNQFLTDLDGNTYNTVTIGTQTWMMENLKTTKYRDGSSIPNVTENNQWINLTSGAYSNFYNTANNAITYGRLYNWYAVSDSRNIAPAGWHVPTNADWSTLYTYLGGESVAGGKLKEIGTTHWRSPNTGATNEVCFTAIPCGYRDHYSGNYYLIELIANWWSASEYSYDQAWTRGIYYNESSLPWGYSDKKRGYSVRCIKD